MRAYVLIDADLSKVRKIRAELRKMPEVLLADIVNGPHPVIACIEGKKSSSVAQKILFDIRRIDGVNDLTVYLGIEKMKDISDIIHHNKKSHDQGEKTFLIDTFLADDEEWKKELSQSVDTQDSH